MVNHRRVAALMVVAVAAAVVIGCVDTRQTVRTVDQHPTGDYSTVQTVEQRVFVIVPGVFEYTGDRTVALWGCQQTDNRMRCNRICDAGWHDNRLCEPRLHAEFGRIDPPSAKVTVAEYRRRLAEISELETQLDAERDGEAQDAGEEQ